MSAPDDLLQLVRAARPADPDEAAAESIAVRTLARLAVLEAGRAVAAPRRSQTSHRLVRTAALVVAFLLPLAALGTGRDAEAPTAPTQIDSSWHARVERSLDGDLLARARVIRGGLAARRALLAAAEQRAALGDGVAAAAALALLRDAGPLRGRREATRVAQLARVATLHTAACEVLARDMGSHGAAHLGVLLAEDPRAADAAVRGLEHVAQRGRREAALQGLLAGVRNGSPEAVAAAVRVGGSTHLGRVLAALPERLFATEARGDEADERTRTAVTAALRSGSRTLRARAVRLAERGDVRALQLVAAARLPGSVRVLAREAAHEDDARAIAAVDLLAGVATVPAWVALARALSPFDSRRSLRASVSERVAQHLRNAPAQADAALLACARRSLRDAPAAMRALAARGSVDALATLARESRLAPAAIHALGDAPAAAASAHLVTLAARPSRSPHVLAALTARWARGHTEAGVALLGLARAGQERAVLRALARGGPTGRALLETAAQDPQLGERARRTLLRLRNAPSNIRVAGRKTRAPQPARSI